MDILKPVVFAWDPSSGVPFLGWRPATPCHRSDKGLNAGTPLRGSDFTTLGLRVDFAVFVDGGEGGSLFLGRDLLQLVEEVLHGCFELGVLAVGD